MSWEAFRLTSKSPAEVLTVMSPSGVDHLLREMLMSCWREIPEDQRTMPRWREEVAGVWNRNIKVWSAIKKPSPQAFFENLLPRAADGHLRQALVLCWMMLPRAGGREFGDVRKIVTEIYARNIAAWEQDNLTFTKGPSRKKAGKKKAKPAKKTKPTSSRKSRSSKR
jgi:hypothetical protein